jgi:hypothetical protein
MAGLGRAWQPHHRSIEVRKMLQDILIDFEYIVVGDHVAFCNQFWKVIKIYKKEDSPLQLPTIILSYPGRDDIVMVNHYKKYRVRPCGSSSRCEELG